MNKIIRQNKKYIFPLMLSAIAIAIGSCGSNPTSDNPDSTESPIASSPLPTPSSEIQTPQIEITTTPTPTVKTAPLGTQTPPSETPSQNKTASSKNVDITLYTSDSQCQELVPKKVSVSVDEPVKDAVGRIITEKDTGDFNISNYRVNVNNGIATVDLRLSPNSPRQLTSLSSCEQFALFGSLRKTLTSNPKWNIKDVRFTEAGQEIVL